MRKAKRAAIVSGAPSRSLFDGSSLYDYTRKRMTVIVKSKSPLTVPDQVRRRAGFKSGDRVEFKVARGVVTILPKRLTSCSPDDTVTEEEAKKVRHALKQVREGKTTPWSRVKHGRGNAANVAPSARTTRRMTVAHGATCPDGFVREPW